MSNFEDSMKANVISSGKSDPPETDLDYYSRPENYTGSNLQSLQRFIIAKDKQEKSLQVVKKLKKKKEGFNLFERYKHILKGYVDEPEPSSSSSEEEDEGEEKKDEQKDVGETETLPKIQEEAEEEEGKIQDEEEQKIQEEKEFGLQTLERLSPDKMPRSPSEQLQEDGKSEISIDRMSPRSRADMTGSPRESIVGTSSKRSIASSSGRQSMMMKAKMQTLAKEVRQQVRKKTFTHPYTKDLIFDQYLCCGLLTLLFVKLTGCKLRI
ncbi:hypothetical protein KUTeg_024002 [Tegillarca granosa]|uniref:Uncharacterized protein n=1 Tax=Tegillarca granosa TaxID=220873 RepID=A0ABQ9DW31_TEGGR|nr:hypothetical protein KUTeg_024002 [Tegillarca granosa]